MRVVSIGASFVLAIGLLAGTGLTVGVIENSDPETGEPAGSWYVTNTLSPTEDGSEVIHTHYALPSDPPEM